MNVEHILIERSLKASGSLDVGTADDLSVTRCKVKLGLVFMEHLVNYLPELAPYNVDISRQNNTNSTPHVS